MKGLKPIHGVKVAPALVLKTPLPSITKSSSFHEAVNSLEKLLVAATDDEVSCELAKQLVSIDRGSHAHLALQAQIECANATEGVGGGMVPLEAVGLPDKKKMKRYQSAGRVLEVVDEGLGDDYQTSGKYIIPDIAIAMKIENGGCSKGGNNPLGICGTMNITESLGPGIMLHFAFYKYMSRAFSL